MKYRMLPACAGLVACLGAAAAAPASENELEAKLPAIFAKAAAHYRALDTAVTPLMKDAKGACRTPHGWNKWRTGRDEYDMRSIFWWTSGHYPGSLWYLFEATGDAFFRERAAAWMETLAPVSKYEGNHDIGFMMYCSYGNARRILKTPKYDAILRETAGTLCRRYNPKLGLIRSWGKSSELANFLVIPDNLMNLELLMQTGRTHFEKIAKSHADVTMRHHFHPDGACYHVLDYDQETGRVQGHRRGQGASVETAWSRGQSWAIYGYTMMYRMTGLVRYLDFAKKLADWAISHPNMPADGIPFWDYGAPGEERDSSAGSIMASALVELASFVGEADRVRYRAFATKQLLALASPAYFSEGNEIGHFLLKHGVGSKPSKSEVDTPLNYGDYYFLEALLRFRQLKRNEAARRKTAALLPAAAGLPADEIDRRLNVKKAVSTSYADRLAQDPVPETPESLYEEFWETGNRTHYQATWNRRSSQLANLVRAEVQQGRGAYLPRIADYLNAWCETKSWVWPAHDGSDGARGNLRGTCYTVDLCSSALAAQFACILSLIGERLDPALVRRVKDLTERRIFAPVRHDLLCGDRGGRRLDWWTVGENNWNAVCWCNVASAALGLLDDPMDRALFVQGAIDGMKPYLSGFTSDGYCSEGMSYWNYGYGHHLMMGLLFRSVSGGRLDIFTQPIQRKVAEYPRSYTLMPGVAPAFADGTGAASKICLEQVDAIWPDLPKENVPASEFPIGQVWLLRNPTGLSVAFKGGHNGEFHNHNDVGSYYVVDAKGAFVAGDPGGETYTRFTFSNKRYESKMLNSFGHPVPVVGGKLQSTGKRYGAKVLSKTLEGDVATVVLDIAGAYDVKTLASLTRTFTFDRRAKTFSVRDRAAFTAPTAFEDCYVTFGKPCSVQVLTHAGGTPATREDVIRNPDHPSPHRFAHAFAPATAFDVEYVYR